MGMKWKVDIHYSGAFEGTLKVHIHAPDGKPLQSTSLGEIHGDYVELTPALLAGKTQVILEIS
jgi:hypothetical protein